MEKKKIQMVKLKLSNLRYLLVRALLLDVSLGPKNIRDDHGNFCIVKGTSLFNKWLGREK